MADWEERRAYYNGGDQAEFISISAQQSVFPYREPLLSNPKFLLADQILPPNPADYLPLFETAGAEVLAGLKLRVQEETREMEEPVPEEVKGLLRSEQDPVSMRSLGAEGYKSKSTSLEEVIENSGPSAALARLYEICMANCWNPLVFECCQETGPGHLREFVFKVVLKMGEVPNEIIEIYGAPRAGKKDAAEHAAQGALWYLKHQGHVWDKKDQGYKLKSESLEEALRKSKVMDPVLIGYDETPYCGTAKSVGIEDSQSGCDEKLYRIINGISKCEPVSKPSRQFPISGNDYGLEPNGTGGPSAVLAKQRLYEICTANCWKPPVFECFQETGPSHLREFLFKVVLEMREAPNEIFEFYGAPRARKKDAAEHAAQGALWYLKHQGHAWDKKRCS